MSVVVHDIELSGLRLPENRPDLRRIRVGHPEHHDAAFDARYDWSTIFYDCFLDHEESAVTLLGPPLLNFEEMILDAQFLLDGREVSIKAIKNLSRCSVVVLDAEDGAILEIKHMNFGGRLVVSPSYTEKFAGQNGAQVISLNNRLEWIHDWLNHNVKSHGLECFVLVDNGSTNYSPVELEATLQAIQGLKQAVIVRARYPFGPTEHNASSFGSLFLQRGMLELGRRRFFANSRAFLNSDIDELFYSYSGQSIFDATVASKDGYVRAEPEWVYATSVQPGQVVRHRDHSHVSQTGLPRTKKKWCLVPNGPQHGKQWKTHYINNRRDPVHPDFRMWHFRQISTSWKFDRSLPEGNLIRCQELSNAMHKAFGEG